MASFRNPRESRDPRRRTPTRRREEYDEIDHHGLQAPRFQGIIDHNDLDMRRELYIPVAYPVTQSMGHEVVVQPEVSTSEMDEIESGSWESSERMPEDTSVFHEEESSVFQGSALGTEYSVYTQENSSQLTAEPPLAERSPKHKRGIGSSYDPWAGPGRQSADTESDDLPLYSDPFPPNQREESRRSVLSHDLEGFSDFEPAGPVRRGSSNYRDNLTAAQFAAASADAANAERERETQEDKERIEKEMRAERQALEASVSMSGKSSRRSGAWSSVSLPPVRDRGETKEEAALGGTIHSNAAEEVCRMQSSTGEEYAEMTNRAVIFTPMVFLLCAVLLIWEFSLNDWTAETLTANPSYGPSLDTLLEAGAKRADLIVDDGEWWRLITPMFLHAGVIHFAFNMIGFVQIGSMIERVFGWWRIGTIFLLSGIFGTIASAVFIPSQLMVGASGAIFGVFGALWADLWQNWRIYGNKCWTLTVLTILTAINIVLGLMPYLDNFAHIGGMVMGFWLGLGLLVQRRIDERGNQLDTKCYQMSLQVASAVVVPVLFVLGLALLYGRSDPSEWCGWCENISCVEFPVSDPWWGCDDCNIYGFEAKAYTNGTISILCPDDTLRFSESCSSANEDDLTDCCIDLCLQDT